MKKVTTSVAIFIISLMMLLTILSGCSSENENGISETISVATSSVVSESGNSLGFPEADPWAKDALPSYRKEVLSREKQNIFLTEEEKIMLKKCGYRIYDNYILKYDPLEETIYYRYSPVIYSYGSSILLWYTTTRGNLDFEQIDTSTHINSLPQYYDIHVDKNGKEKLRESEEESVLLNTKKSKIEVYHFGKLLHSVSFPKGAKYCGISYWNGYIFRLGGDVYSINLVRDSCICIAHGVKFVISTDYKFNSDAWSQPLFHMEDGSVRAYIGWSMYGQEPDDPGHLRPLETEGDYKKR